MTQVGESAAVTSITEQDTPYHFSAIQICYPNGSPYTERVPLLATLNGSKNPSPVNFDGLSFQSHLEPGTSISYEIGHDPVDELTKTRQEIKAFLDQIIASEREQQKHMDAVFDSERWWVQETILLGAFMSGVGDGAMGLVEFTGDIAVIGAKGLWVNFQQYGNMLEVSWDKYVEGDKKGYAESLKAENAKDFADAFGITPTQLADNLLAAYEMMAFIAEDSEVQKMLADFSIDYLKAQSKVEKVNIAGSAGFDIILAAVLAMTTGGAGNAAQIAAKIRHSTQLKGLAIKFKQLLKLQKEKALHTPEVKGSLDNVVKHTITLPTAPKIKVNKPKDSALEAKKKDDKKTNDNDQKNSDETGKNDGNTTCSPDDKTCQGGEPISLVTGEEILPLTDFTLDGPLSLPWERRYKSSNLQNIGLGYGWTHPFAESLSIVENGSINYRNSEARTITLPLPIMSGDTTTNRAEQLQLTRTASNRYSLRPLGAGANVEKIFSQQQNGGTLVLSQIRDSFGNHFSLTHSYVAKGIERLSHISASTGSQWQLHYNEHAQLTHIDWQTAAGHQQTLSQYQYDSEHDLTTATDAKGNSEQYSYSHHLIKSRTLKSGYSYHFLWDGNTNKARCVRNWGDHINGQPTYDYSFKWDTPNNRVAITDTRGGTETYQFNDRGLPIYHQDQEGGVTRYRYDDRGNLVNEKNPLGADLRYIYDYTNDQLRTFIDTTGAQHQLERDSLGNITASIDPLGNRWQRRYNEQGQLSQQTNPLGEGHSYQYNALGLISRITNPLEQSWHYIWNNQGQLTALRDPNGQHTRYRYNAANQIDTITYPDETDTQYRYDANGQCTAIKGPDGEVQQFAYSPLGLLTHQGDSSGKTTEYQYNGLSQVVKRIDPLGHTLDYHYDGERNLIGLTNEKGEHYHLRYDLNERLIEEVGFDGRIQQYHYNPAGHLIASDDYSVDGKTLLGRMHYQRDNTGRLIKQYEAGLQAANDETQAHNTLLNSFNYDALGRITDAQNDNRHLQWRYDAVGRVIEDHQDQHTLLHRYNAIGHRTASQLPNGETVNYQYDNNGAFTGLNYGDTSVASITRDSLGREIKRALSNDLTTEHNYDPQGRLQRQATYKAGTDASRPSISQRSYSYTQQGQLSQIDDLQRGTTHYHYDAVNRLTQVKGPNPESFVHDPAGNILAIDSVNDKKQAKAEAPNHANQVQGNRLKFQGDTHYRYDDKGNRIGQARGKGKKLKTAYRYNSLNQLAVVNNNGLKTVYKYDALGRRIAKQNKQQHVDFLWLEDVLLSETTQTAENAPQTKTYLFEPNTFKPLAFVQDETVYHYHLDHLGTPQEITNANGEIVWAASFKAYGNLAVAIKSDIENNIRFQGQYYDGETGMHYNRFRYYDPECGRFVNQDPIGLLGGSNNYQYVPNPVGWVDPFGLSCKEIKGKDGGSYDAMNPGPLPDEVAATFAGGKYKEITLVEDTILYRGGEKGKGLGQYFTSTPPDSVAKVRIDSAVKSQWIDPETGILTGSSPIDTVHAVKIPKGTKIYEGPVGYQGGPYLGGQDTSQIFVSKPWDIPKVDVVSSTPLE